MTPEQTAHMPAWAVWLSSTPGQIIFPTIVSLTLIAIIALVRWLMSRSAWPYHPKGAGGFLVDELLRYALFFLPFVVVGIGIRVYFYLLHPELKGSPLMWACFMLMLVARIVVRRLPIAKAVARHIDAAKAKAREAQLAGRP